MTPSTDAPRVLVTGASRRVGRAIALRLAERGAEVVLHARRRHPEIEATAEAIAARHPDSAPARICECDLADPSRVGGWLRALADERWDGVVLNAASYSRLAPLAPGEAIDAFATRAAREAESHFRVNAGAALAIALGMAPALARSTRPGGGAIVALGDIHARGRPVKGYAPYLMSKAALAAMIDSLAVELAPRVRVNAVHPGVVAWPEGSDAEVRAAYESRIPLQRSGTPEDAAGAVAWLLLDATYLTGVHLPVDGGRSLR